MVAPCSHAHGFRTTAILGRPPAHECLDCGSTDPSVPAQHVAAHVPAPRIPDAYSTEHWRDAIREELLLLYDAEWSSASAGVFVDAVLERLAGPRRTTWKGDPAPILICDTCHKPAASLIETAFESVCVDCDAREKGSPMGPTPEAIAAAAAAQKQAAAAQAKRRRENAEAAAEREWKRGQR